MTHCANRNGYQCGDRLRRTPTVEKYLPDYAPRLSFFLLCRLSG